jgi:hypothetical protein
MEVGAHIPRSKRQTGLVHGQGPQTRARSGQQADTNHMSASMPNPRKTDRASRLTSRPSFGVAENAGGIGIVLPMATNIAPSLTPWAVGLSTIILLAIGFHLRRHESPLAPGVLLLLALFVVFGRFSDWR